MPLYSIQGPDGRTYSIEGPPGATREQVIQAIQARMQEPAQTITAPPVPQPEQSGVLRQILDVPLQVARGGVGGIRMLADLFGAGSSASEALRSADTWLADLLSSQAKNDQRRIAEILKEAEDKGVLAQVGAGLRALATAPVDTLAQALGSTAPVIIAGLASGPVGAALGVARAGAVAMPAVGAAMGVGEVKGSIYEAVEQAYKEKGASDEVARAKALEAQSYASANLPSMVVGGGLGALAGGMGIERPLASMLGRGAVRDVAEQQALREADRGLASRVGLGALREGAPEFAQAGQSQLAQNLALINEGFDVPLFRNVFGAGAMEGAAGAILGGGLAIPRTGVERLPGQRDGESDSDFARRMSREIDAARNREQVSLPTAPIAPVAPTVSTEDVYQFPDGSVGTIDQAKAYAMGVPVEQRQRVLADILSKRVAKEKTAPPDLLTEQPTEAVETTVEPAEKPVEAEKPTEITEPPKPPAVALTKEEEEVAEEATKEKPVQNYLLGYPIYEIPIEQLSLSKDVPQFKGDADVEGVVEKLEGTFDQRGVAPIQVWKRTDGRMEIISGRHRFDLAKRSGEKLIRAQIHEEATGFDADQASILDAELNIRDQQGKGRDYVAYFRKSGISEEDAKARGLLGRAPGKPAFAIAKNGSDELVAAHRADIVSDAGAAAIANAAPGDSRLQAVGVKAIQEGKSPLAAVNTIKAVQSLSKDRPPAEGGDLFGFDDSAMREAEEMAKIATSKQNQLAQRIAAISGASRRPEIAKKEGIDIKDPEALQKREKELRQQKAAWDNWPSSAELVEEIRKDMAPKEKPAETPKISARASLREAIQETKTFVENSLADWKSRAYKANEKSVELTGEGPRKRETMTVGEINENRRRKAIENLTDELNAIKGLERRTSSDEGADRFLTQARNLYKQAEEAVKEKTTSFATPGELFEYLLLNETLDIKPAGKGSYSSNSISKAVRKIIESEPVVVKEEIKPVEPVKPVSDEEILSLFDVALQAGKPSVREAPEQKELPPEIQAKVNALGKALKRILTRYGLGDVAVRLVEDMKAEGEYASKVLSLALDATDPVVALRHEAIHALKELGFFTPQQWKSLERQAKEKWVDQYLKQKNVNREPLQEGQMSRYDAYMKFYGGDEEAIIEEAIADAFGDFSVKAPPGMLQAILKRLKNLFQGIKEAFGAEPEAERIFAKVERGELRGRPEVSPEVEEEAKPSLRGKKEGIPSIGPRIDGKYLERIENIRRQIGDEYVAGKISFDEFQKRHSDTNDEYVKALVVQQRLEEARPAEKLEEVFPGFVSIPVGTRILATPRSSSGLPDPSPATVVDTIDIRVGSKAFRLPIVEFADGKRKRLTREDIKDVFAPRLAKPSLRDVPLSTRGIMETAPVYAMDELGLKTTSEKKPGNIDLFNDVRSIARALNNDTLTREGAIKEKDYSLASAIKLARAMADEISFQVGATAKTGTGLGWYSSNYPKSVKKLAKRFPELETDPYARTVFSALVAITSNGEKVATNVKNAINLYADIREGKDVVQPGSRRASAMENNLSTLKMLMDKFGPDLRAELMREITVKDMNAALRAAAQKPDTSYLADTKVPASAIYFGPKLGAFFSNLEGAEGYLTMDLWWTRTMNRMRGLLMPKATAASINKFRELMDRPNATREEVVSATIPLRNKYEEFGFKTELEHLVGSKEPSSKSPDLPKWNRRARALAGPAYQQLVFEHRAEKLANTIHKNEFEMLEEAPFTASDRKFMYRTAREAQRMLRENGIDLSLADIQAALWYYEKRLYQHLSGRKADDIGYDEAIEQLAGQGAGPSGPALVFNRQPAGGPGAAGEGAEADRLGGVGKEAKPSLRDTVDVARLYVDVPNEEWLQSQIDYAIKKGRNRWGVPYMGKITASYRSAPVDVPVSVLEKIPGQRDEQNNRREESLDYIRKNWDAVSKEPPYIEVAYNGEAWVSEGNHRIMVAAEKGIKSLPVEIRYFDGGERKAGPLAPNRILDMTKSAERDLTKPDIKASLRGTINPAVFALADQITTPRDDRSFIRRIIDAISPKSASHFRAAFLDRYDILSKYEKELVKQMGGAPLLADASAHSAALMSDTSAGVLASAMGVHDGVGGIPVYDKGYTHVINNNNTVKGPIAIFAPLAKYNDPDIYRLYQTWAAVKRGIRLYSQGRPTGIIDPADQATIAALPPAMVKEFEDIQKEWIKFNDGLVKYLVDTGVLSVDQGKEFVKYSDYIPFYRQAEGEKTVGPQIFASLSGVRQPKKLKESEAPIGEFLETVIRNVQYSIEAGMKNVAAQRSVRIAESIGMAQRLNYVSSAPNVVKVLENGQTKYYAAQDMLFVEAMKSLNLGDLPFIGLLAGPANLLRALVTKDPAFMLANMMRDSMSAWVSTGVKMTPVVDTITNFSKALAGNNPEYDALLNSGVIGGYDYSQGLEASAERFNRELRKAAGVSSTGEKLAKPFTSLWDALEKGTTASDAATRMEIYKKTLAETGNEAEAIFRALEVMNFNRKGNNPLVRVLTAAVPFLNARMQGLDVLYRAAFAQGSGIDPAMVQKRFFVRGMTIAALSAMYWMLVHEDDEWKKQEQETRDNYWILGDVKIPIPFEIGVLFKVIPERILEYSFGNDTGKDFMKSMARQLTNTLAFNPIPQTALPIIESVTNYSFFTQRPIVSQGLEDVAPAYQIAPGTSRIGELAGEATKGLPTSLQLSPVKVDELIRGYTGTIGGYMMDLFDAIYDMNSDAPKAAKRFEQMPVIRRFAVDPEARGQVTAYYELKNAVDEATRTANLLERNMNPQEWGEFMEENMGLLATKDYVLDLEKSMKQYREMKNMVRASTMSADEKKDVILDIIKLENQLASNIQEIKKMIAAQ